MARQFLDLVSFTNENRETGRRAFRFCKANYFSSKSLKFALYFNFRVIEVYNPQKTLNFGLQAIFDNF